MEPSEKEILCIEYIIQLKKSEEVPQFLNSAQNKKVSFLKRFFNKTIRYNVDEIRPFIKSITGDNGKEFSAHQFITDEYCNFFFANPYSPWERGSNENLNGLVRQYIPKSSDFSIFSDERIKEIQTKINNRPRKRYDYENPKFVTEKLLFNPEVALVA